jgi:F-type H+-transporting ATPase subunit gamma
MPSLKEVRIRIASVNSTKQITSAMKMVSASKLRRAQDRILGLRPYYTEMKKLVHQVIFDVPFQIQSPFFEKRSGGRCLFVVMASNRGLCGVFNSNVNKYLNTIIKQDEFASYAEQDKIDYIVFGKRAVEFLKKRDANILASYEDVMEKPQVDQVFKITEEILNNYQQGQWDEVFLIYNQYRNPAFQEVIHDKFVPLQMPDISPEHFYPEIEFIYQPDVSSIVDRLIPDYLRATLLKAIFESSAGENGARMTAMHKATDNATELIKELKLTYNKARQASITKEIIEIVSGANALE